MNETQRVEAMVRDIPDVTLLAIVAGRLIVKGEQLPSPDAAQILDHVQKALAGLMGDQWKRMDDVLKDQQGT